MTLSLTDFRARVRADREEKRNVVLEYHGVPISSEGPKPAGTPILYPAVPKCISALAVPPSTVVPGAYNTGPRTASGLTLVGMGDPGEYCGVPRIAQVAYDIDEKPLRARIGSYHCSKLECPICYTSVLTERVFEISVLLESFARCYGERPAAIEASLKPELTMNWSKRQIELKLYRRVYRHLKSMNANYGVRFTHPFRISPEIKCALRKKGYAEYGENIVSLGGYWEGVHNDALELPSWRDYVVWGLHVHLLVFPSFLKQHDDPELMVKKYAVLATVKDIVDHVEYLFTHLAKEIGSDDHTWARIRRFAGPNAWRPEDKMTKEDIDQVRIAVARAMGLFYDVGRESICYREPKPEDKMFQPVYSLVGRMLSQIHQDWRDTLTKEQFDWCEKAVVHLLNREPLVWEYWKDTYPEGFDLDTRGDPADPEIITVVELVTETADIQVESVRLMSGFYGATCELPTVPYINKTDTEYEIRTKTPDIPEEYDIVIHRRGE